MVNGLSGRVTGGGHSKISGRWAPTTAAVAWATVEWQPANHRRRAGKKLGGIFPHFGLGISDRAEDDVIYNCSAWGKDSPPPPSANP